MAVIVAILGGLVVFLMFLALSLWCTCMDKANRIAELEALHAPPTSAPWSMIRAREEPLDRVTETDLPMLFPMEGNRDKTQVSRYT